MRIWLKSEDRPLDVEYLLEVMRRAVRNAVNKDKRAKMYKAQVELEFDKDNNVITDLDCGGCPEVDR